jgi:hypothetical protein
MLRILPSGVPFSSPRCVRSSPCGPVGLVCSFLNGIRSWNERSKESTLGVNQGKQVEVTFGILIVLVADSLM